MMQNNIYKKFINQQNYYNNENYTFICSFLIDIGFSTKIKYLFFKRRFLQFSLLTKSTKSINLRLKLSRFEIKKINNLGSLTGFYRAI